MASRLPWFVYDSFSALSAMPGMVGVGPGSTRCSVRFWGVEAGSAVRVRWGWGWAGSGAGGG
ncbi:hypothetical protein MMJ09_20450, partial [Bacillus vallismortis]|nr:hypothetical protein [Bacillus vallismortis]